MNRTFFQYNKGENALLQDLFLGRKKVLLFITMAKLLYLYNGGINRELITIATTIVPNQSIFRWSNQT